MFKKRCSGCGKKISKDFNYCPHCGFSYKQQKSEEDLGMLGDSDEINQIANQIQLPPGMGALGGMINGLMKQMEKELGNMERVEKNQNPQGFRIEIRTGQPKMQQISAQPQLQFNSVAVSKEEKERRKKLRKVEAKSNLRRLPEGVIYEIDAPGVSSKEDVVITRLETSTEIKVYSSDRCYVKTLPLKIEILEFAVRDNKVFLRLKG